MAVACGGSGGSNSNSSSNNNGSTNTGGSTNNAGGTNNNGGTSTAGSITPAAMASNVATLTVDGGPSGLSVPDSNMSFVTIVVCPPGTPTANVPASCTTIDHVFVDTGSDGLRIPSEVFTPSQLASLPNVKISPSNSNTPEPIAECIQYAGLTFNLGLCADGRCVHWWIEQSGRSGASDSHPILAPHGGVDTSVPTGNLIPSACSTTIGSNQQSTPAQEQDTVATLGAKALIGVGPTSPIAILPEPEARGGLGAYQSLFIIGEHAYGRRYLLQLSKSDDSVHNHVPTA